MVVPLTLVVGPPVTSLLDSVLRSSFVSIVDYDGTVSLNLNYHGRLFYKSNVYLSL